MSDYPDGITVSKPKSVFTKPLSLDIKSLLTGVAKGIAHAATGNFTELPGDVIDVAAGLGIDSSANESGYLLISRALYNAAFDLAQESASHFNQIATEAKPILREAVSSKVGSVQVTIGKDFLSNPRSLSLIKEIVPIFEQWLVDQGATPHVAQVIARRYDSYFVYALASEWRKNHSEYKDLVEAIQSPFGAAEDRERDWENYFAMLVRRTDENIFDEPFSLSQIYVPLNAYYVEKKSMKNGDSAFAEQQKRTVIDLEYDLISWLARREKNDALRVLSGGPGSGKSSFMKMLCAKICEKRSAKPIYIPLHLIDPTRDVADEVGRFIREEGFLRFNPLDPDLQINDLLLIFDGLDELASQGKVAAQVAKDFVQAVERMVERRNLGRNSILVLISGRELVVQENETEFRRPKQILNVLPYFLPENERNDYVDTQSLLTVDLRNTWWKKYGELTEHEFDGVPQNLRKHEIDEITAQPLLNYLVALSFTRGKLDFEQSLNLNNVYADLVAAVYERGYENNRIHKPINHIDQKDFVRVMEEIGLAAWHGSDGRSTSVNEILAHCKESGLESLITTFQEGAKAGVTKLLAAFFFRKNGEQASGDATFVFTHKSFGEYLTAVRIVRGIERIVIQLQRRVENPDDGYDLTQGLVQWVKLAGPAQMTGYIRKFLIRQVEERPEEELRRWQARLSDLLGQAIEKHMPMEKIGNLNFQEATRQNNNASECLVIAVNSCASALSAPIQIRFNDKASFGSFLRRITPQRTGANSPILYQSLSHFDLSGQYLDMVDLYGANLSHSNWTDVKAHYSNLATANFTGAILDGAIFREANLSSARLTGASLKRTSLEMAKLSHVNFNGANLSNADISYADLFRANFKDAISAETKAEGFNFTQTKDVSQAFQRGLIIGDKRINLRHPPTVKGAKKAR